MSVSKCHKTSNADCVFNDGKVWLTATVIKPDFLKQNGTADNGS